MLLAEPCDLALGLAVSKGGLFAGRLQLAQSHHVPLLEFHRRLACLLQAGLGGFSVFNRLGRGGVGFAPLRFGAERRLLGGTGPGRSGGDLLSGLSSDRVDLRLGCVGV